MSARRDRGLREYPQTPASGGDLAPRATLARHRAILVTRAARASIIPSMPALPLGWVHVIINTGIRCKRLRIDCPDAIPDAPTPDTRIPDAGV